MAQLAELHALIAVCPDCPLAKTRTHAVPGEGPEDAEVMFVGEAPGFYEDQQARPFVGPAGKFLEELIAAIGLRREQVFICNIIKCRPPNNRDPLPGEIEACRKWLEQQLELIRPKVVVPLGRYSLQHFLPGQSIGRVHGQRLRRGEVVLVPMYHPAAALHQGSMRRVIEEDFKKLPAYLEEARRQRPQPPEPAAQQMRLL